MKVPLVLCTMLLCLSSNSVMPQQTLRGVADLIKHDKKAEIESPNLVACMQAEDQDASTRNTPIDVMVLAAAVQCVSNLRSASVLQVRQDDAYSDIDDIEFFERSLSQSFVDREVAPIQPVALSAGFNATPSNGCLLDLLSQDLKAKAPVVPHTATPPSPFRKKQAPVLGVAYISSHEQPAAAQDHQSNTPSPIKKPASPEKK